MTEDALTGRRAPEYLHQVAGAFVAVSGVGILVAIIMLSRGDPDGDPVQAVFDFVEHLPASGWLYVAVGSIVLLGLASYWYQFEKTKSDFAILPVYKEKTGLGGDREILVVRELRLRAMALRTRAALFLGSSIMLLLGGTYATIWVVPKVPSYDTQEQIRAHLQFKFGDTLDALGRGKYWLHALDVSDSRPSLRVSPDGKEDVKEFVVATGDHDLVSTNGLDWEQRDQPKPIPAGNSEAIEPDERTEFHSYNGSPPDFSVGSLGILEVTEIAVYLKDVGEEHWNRIDWNQGGDSMVKFVEFDSGGTHGLIATGDGALHVTANGGESWTTWTGQSIGLNGTEWAVGAAVDSDGPSVVVGDEGTVRVWGDDGWATPKGADDWPSVKVVEFGADGQHGLVGTSDGAVHVTADGGESWATWTGQSIGLNGTEWAVDAAVGSDGPRVIVGDEGTVRVRDGDGWATPKGADDRPSVTVVEFGAGGQHGLVGTSDGAVHVTANGGESWATWAGQSIGLNGTEWAVGAVVGSDGPRVIVGDEGTVRVREGDGWATPRGAGHWRFVRTVEFGASGQHGVVGTSDGAVHVTADSGASWTLQENLTSNESWTWTPAFVGHGRFVLLRTGPVVYTTEDGINWSPSEELTKAAPLEIEDLYVVGDDTVLSTTSGTAWLKGDDGWSQLRTGFGSDESIAAILVDEDEPIVVGSKGATFMRGQLDPGRGDFEPEEEHVVAAAAVSGTLVALFEGKDGHSIYVRQEFPDELVDDPQALFGALPGRGKLKRDLATELAELDRTVNSTPRSLDNATLIQRLGVGQVHWLRTVAMLATIYLVQLFVKLYRYSVRLAAHWDSRADAVLLGHSFSGTNPSFKDLVSALGPDALDFKPPRYSYFPSWRRPDKPDESS